jgi:hypothetical protein
MGLSMGPRYPATGAMNRALNVIGLLLNLAGVVILFRYGMPFHVPTGGAVPLITETRDQATIALEQRYEILGYIGLASLLVGTICQGIAACRA